MTGRPYLAALSVISIAYSWRTHTVSKFPFFSSSRLFATTDTKESLTSTTTAPPIDKRETPIDAFISSLKGAYRGDTGRLYGMLSSSCKWETPVCASVTDFKEALAQFSAFFQEPVLTVFQCTETSPNTFAMEYHMSFWYPMPWRPRIIVPCKAQVTLGAMSQIESVRETWEVSLIDIFLKQFPPRYWDMVNSFSTPSPEYPPTKKLASVGKVSFVEIPQTIAVEIQWSAPSKYPGPPLLAMPGFGLFGDLRTSRPNRDALLAVLPIEVQSSRFTATDSNEDMKQTSWILHVPSCLHDLVMDKAQAGTVTVLRDEEEADSEDDAVDETDYQVGLENANVMKSITGGVLRGVVAVDEELMRAFERSERKDYRYRVMPRRVVAQVEIKGDASPEKISAALSEIKAVVLRAGEEALGRPVRMVMRDLDAEPSLEGVPRLGLQLWGCKGCFNPRGEPAMAAYELQYSSRITTVFVELVQ